MIKFPDPGRIAIRNLWLRRHARKFAEQYSARRPRLLVDVSVILQHDAQTGIQRVVRAIWSELRKRDSTEFELVPVYATHRRGYCYAPIDFLEARGQNLLQEPVCARPNDRFLGLDLSAQFLPRYERQLRAWRAAGATLHLIVYDILPLVRPDFFNPSTVSHFQRWFKSLAKHADEAICISRQVGRDVRDRLRLSGVGRMPDVSYLNLGGDIGASQPSTGVCQNVVQLLGAMRFRPTILMVGTVEPRKGYDVALDAFEHLWATRGSEAPDLVIVGKSGWKTEALQRRLRLHFERGNRLHWLDSVSDEGLCNLYDASRGLLMTSHAEGFGLPLLEAVTHRRHVLARDLPVFREQNLPHVRFFECDSPESLGQAILELAAAGAQPARIPVDLPTWSGSVDCLIRHLKLGEILPYAATNETVAKLA